MTLSIDKIPKVISQNDERILRSHLKSRRDKIVFDLLLYTGIRANELSNILKTDIDFTNYTIKILGKGRKERLVPLNNDVIVSLSKYIQGKKRDSKYLITTFNETAITSASLYKLMDRLGNRSGIKLHPHMFRHTFCTRLMDKGVNIEKIAELAGHSSLDTTRIYAKVTVNEKHNAVAKLKHRKFFNLSRHKENIYNNIVENYENRKIDIHRTERRELNTLFKQRISTIILGPSGIGKTHELRYLKKKKNVIWLSSLQNKTDFKKMIEVLNNRKFFKHLEKEGEDLEKTLKEIVKGNIKGMIDIIPAKILSDHIFVIDEVGMIGKQIKKHIIELKSKVTIFCSAYENNLFANEFKMVELMPLKRLEVSIIIKNNYPSMTEKKHLEMLDVIFNKSLGFPRRVNELMQRYRKTGENLLYIKQDKSIETTQTHSLGFGFLLVLLVMVVFSLKLGTKGVAVTAFIYIALILGRMFFYRYSSKV